MVPYSWICMATMLGNSKNYSPKLCPAIPKAINLMALNRKDHVLVGIYNQQFHGTIILVVFDLQGVVSW